ncbi:uncharacterized protein [Pleurodeles waltl]|uniref:uncharacterized protein isoform X3 n=1 Tax=Pleurodeles waltl TaxID=8319 RepID=UPI003709A0AF
MAVKIEIMQGENWSRVLHSPCQQWKRVYRPRQRERVLHTATFHSQKRFACCLINVYNKVIQPLLQYELLLINENHPELLTNITTVTVDTTSDKDWTIREHE